MKWEIILVKKVQKVIRRLPKNIQSCMFLLFKEIEEQGPVRGNWPNYGKLSRTTHHCHIKKGNPTYVAVWEARDKEIRLIEVKYVGTHEKAPY